MNLSKLSANDRATIYRYNQGSDMRLSNAQRLLGADLTIDKVMTAYSSLDNKMAVLNKADISYKTFSRWKCGECEPMYHRIADLYEYILEELDAQNSRPN